MGAGLEEGILSKNINPIRKNYEHPDNRTGIPANIPHRAQYMGELGQEFRHYSELAELSGDSEAYLHRLARPKHLFLLPIVTLHSYPDSAYRLTFEFNWLDYTFRRGIWRIDGEEPRPVDNTPGFVTSEWFAQFRKDSDHMMDIEQIFAGLRDALTKIKEEMEKE